jgi:hypothetical protein
MAYVKSMRVVYTKGVDDPFTLTAIVRKTIGGSRDRQQFDEDHKKIGSYVELIALCAKYVIMDDTKERGTEPEYGERRDIYDDKIVPWRQRVWDTAKVLLSDARVVGTWTVFVAEYHSEVTLNLQHITASGVYSPSVGLEAGKHSFSPSMVKIRTHPGLAMNLPLEKATPKKIADKLVERAEEQVARINARHDRDTEALRRREKAKRIVQAIETQFGIPRYYEGSGSLKLATEGISINVEPTEYGTVNVTVSVSIGDEPVNVHADRLEPLVNLVKAVKVNNDHAKAKKEIDAKRALKLTQKS